MVTKYFEIRKVKFYQGLFLVYCTKYAGERQLLRTGGLDILYGNVPIKSVMVKMTLISNINPQVSHHSVRSKETSLRSHEWNKHIADKKSLMALIFS